MAGLLLAADPTRDLSVFSSLAQPLFLEKTSLTQVLVGSTCWNCIQHRHSFCKNLHTFIVIRRFDLAADLHPNFKLNLASQTSESVVIACCSHAVQFFQNSWP